ncbi:MAG: FHA domain-containing protein [Desulfovibrionaceae bacterium]
MASSSYLLKILSGINAGAEVEIRSTSIIMGGLDECDVVLSDPFLAQRTIPIELYEDSLSITTNSLQFYINGFPVTEEIFSVAFYEVITVATTSFVVGRSDELWPDITMPEKLIDRDGNERSFKESIDSNDPMLFDLESGKAELNDTVGIAQKENSDRGTFEEISSEAEEEFKAEELFLEEENEENVEEGKKRKKKNNSTDVIKKITYAIIVTCLFLISILIWFFFLRQPDIGSEEYITNLNTDLREEGFPSLRVGVRKPDLLIVTGFVDTKEDLNKLENFLKGRAPKILILVKYMDQVMAEIEEYLNSNGIRFTLQLVKKSKRLNVYGYIKDGRLLAKVQEDLQDLLPIFRNIRWNVIFWTELSQLLEEPLQETNLGPYLEFVPYSYSVLVSGELTNAEKDMWEEIKKPIIASKRLYSGTFIEKFKRIRSREDTIEKEKRNNISMEKEAENPVLKLLGIPTMEKISKASISDVPEGASFDEYFIVDPCKYLSIQPGEIIFVKINGEPALYSSGSMLPAGIKIKDILEKSIVLEKTDGSFIFCNQ